MMPCLTHWLTMMAWQVVDWVQEHMEELRKRVLEYRSARKKNRVTAM